MSTHSGDRSPCLQCATGPATAAAMEEEESGWKYVHGDVFRFPPYKNLFCAFVGTGTQVRSLTQGGGTGGAWSSSTDGCHHDGESAHGAGGHAANLKLFRKAEPCEHDSCKQRNGRRVPGNRRRRGSGTGVIGRTSRISGKGLSQGRFTG